MIYGTNSSNSSRSNAKSKSKNNSSTSKNHRNLNRNHTNEIRLPIILTSKTNWYVISVVIAITSQPMVQATPKSYNILHAQNSSRCHHWKDSKNYDQRVYATNVYIQVHNANPANIKMVNANEPSSASIRITTHSQPKCTSSYAIPTKMTNKICSNITNQDVSHANVNFHHSLKKSIYHILKLKNIHQSKMKPTPSKNQTQSSKQCTCSKRLKSTVRNIQSSTTSDELTLLQDFKQLNRWVLELFNNTRAQSGWEESVVSHFAQTMASTIYVSILSSPRQS
eukprot:TCONS_00038646-protein